MENASKALLIAGGALLVILILSFTIYMFSRMANSSEKFYTEMSQAEIDTFNQKFFKFETQYDESGKVANPLTAQDILTLVNIANDTNGKQTFPTEIEVEMNETSLLSKGLDEILKMEGKYSCQIEYAENSQFVGKVIITKIST